MSKDLLKLVEEYEEARMGGSLYGDAKALEIADDIANMIKEMHS